MTQLGTLLLRSLDAISGITGAGDPGIQPDITRGYLSQLRDETAAVGSQLLTLVIPKKDDLTAHTAEYRTAVELLHDMGLPRLEAIDMLEMADYRELDEHWNSAGHQKVGAVLTDCLQAYFASGDLSACEGVIAP